MISPGSILPVPLAARPDAGFRIVTAVQRIGGDDERPLLYVSSQLIGRRSAPQSAAPATAEASSRRGAAEPATSRLGALVDPRSLTLAQSLAQPEETAPHGHGPRAAPTAATEERAGDGRDADGLSPAQQRAVEALRRRDGAVRQEEQTHAAQAGQFAGAPIYQYQLGPDGRRYAVAGEVPVRVRSSSGDPEQMKRALAVLRQAAIAPAAPSAQDLSVARFAASRIGAVDEKARANLLDLTTEQGADAGGAGRLVDVVG